MVSNIFSATVVTTEIKMKTIYVSIRKHILVIISIDFFDG